MQQMLGGLRSVPARTSGQHDARTIFSRNLGVLLSGEASVSQFCRDIGLNRTQFNRYLSGETHPRPDVLERICRYFRTDARILLEPIEKVAAKRTDADLGGGLKRLSAQMRDFDHGRMPDGCYLLTRPVMPGQAIVSLMSMRTSRAGIKFAHTAVPQFFLQNLGLSRPWRLRRCHGPAFQCGEGVAIYFSAADAMSMQMCYFGYGYLSVPTLHAGYVALATSPGPHVAPVVPAILERLPPGLSPAIAARRGCGLVRTESLAPYLQRYFEDWDPMLAIRGRLAR